MRFLVLMFATLLDASTIRQRSPIDPAQKVSFVKVYWKILEVDPARPFF